MLRDASRADRIDHQAYEEKRSKPPRAAEIKREIGCQRFGKHAGERLLQQHHYAPGIGFSKPIAL
ncbi:MULTISPECIES: hypothetical protein [Streptomyces]|uniref:Uncharacterized protein n=1 Tax=Streptomyces ehimensis TaxID=68195 RepID=A0ABV9BWC3_9ACTN